MSPAFASRLFLFVSQTINVRLFKVWNHFSKVFFFSFFLFLSGSYLGSVLTIDRERHVIVILWKIYILLSVSGSCEK